MKKIIAIILIICSLTVGINTYLSYQRYNKYIGNLSNRVKNSTDVLIDVKEIYRHRLKIKEFINYTDKEWRIFWENCKNYIDYGYEKSLREDLYRILNNIKNISNDIKSLKIPKGDEYICNKTNEVIKKLNEIIYKLELEINKEDEGKLKEYFKDYKIINKEMKNLIKILEEPIYYEI